MLGKENAYQELELSDNGKMMFMFLTLFCLTKDTESIPTINPQPLADQINDFIEKALKRSEMQDFLDSLPQEKIYTETEDIDKIASLIENKFEKRVNVVKKISGAVKDSYSDVQSSLSVTPCCQYKTTTYDDRFKTQVNTNDMCSFTFADTPNNHRLKTPVMLNVFIENLKYLPSLKWQYFASEEKVLYIYPAVATGSCVMSDIFDYRLRPWYVQANSPQSKYVVIVIDTSGSMGNTRNRVSLLDDAKTAARYVVATLNPHDKFAIVAFSTSTLVLGAVWGQVDPCYSYTLAQAIPLNKEKAYRFIKQLTPQGGNFFKKALSKAYHFFLIEEQLNIKADPSTQRVIVMLSDGQADDSLTNIYDAINFTISSYPPNNHKYVTMTYGLGNGDFSILKSLALENPFPSKVGNFTALNDMSIITQDVASFYKFFGGGNRNLTVPIWTLPYQDGLGLDEVVTGSLPVYIEDNLIGIIGIDIYTKELFASSMYFKPNQFSYSFVVDGKGLLIFHPILDSIENDGTRYLDATSVERESEFKSVYKSMRRGESGSKIFNATKISRKNSRNLHPQNRTANILSTYNWTKIRQANYSLCFVLVDSGSSLNFSNTQPHPSGTFFYHRLDLISPPTECFHLSKTAITNQSTVFFSTRSFTDPEDYITNEYTAKNVRSITEFVEGRGPNTLKLKAEAKQDSVLTYKAYKLWLENVDAALQVYVLWRFIATRNGVLRLYPGVQHQKRYDPPATTWYESVLHDPQKNVVTPPNLDFQVGISVVTFCRALLQRREDKIFDGHEEDVYAVMGVNVILSNFYDIVQNLYREWLGANYCKLYLLDRDSFVVLADEYINRGIQEVTHLTKVEPQISNKLILEKILVRDNCTLTSNGLLQRQYILTMSAANYKSKIYDGNERCIEFSIVSVPNSNLYILVRTTSSVSCQSGPGIEARGCVCEKENCVTAWENEEDCECPCEDENPFYDTCKNIFKTESPYMCTRVTKQSIPLVPTASFMPKFPACYNLLFEYSISRFIPAVAFITSLGLFLVGTLICFFCCMKRRDQKLKSKVRKEKIRYLLDMKASNVEEYIKYLMNSDNDAARIALAKIAGFLYRLAQPSNEVLTNLEESPYYNKRLSIHADKRITSDIRVTQEASFIAENLSSLLFEVDNLEQIRRSAVFPLETKSTKHLLKAPSSFVSQKASSPEFQKRSIEVLKKLMNRSLLSKIPAEDTSLESFVASVKRFNNLQTNP